MSTPRTFGILAHVDAGKTTLSEQLLYRAGALRAPGRVDHGNTALDTEEIERTRGITVFSNQAWLEHQGRRFTMIDTPGHIDFATEAERALSALDMAVLVVDGSSELDAHTEALFHLLTKDYQLPLLFFINKTDLPAYDEARILSQISQRLTQRIICIRDGQPDPEQLAVLDDNYLEAYLEGTASEAMGMDTLKRLAGQVYPVLTGAALSGQGVDELLHMLCLTAEGLDASVTAGSADEAEPFRARVYQVRHDANGERVTFLRILSGTLRPRDPFRFDGNVEKVHQLRLYRGAAFSSIEQASAGDAVGVTGLTTPRCGDLLLNDTLDENAALQLRRFQPVLAVRVLPPEGVSPTLLLEKLRILEDEDPTLNVQWDAPHSVALVQVMGEVQMEVLTQLLSERFGLKVQLLPPLVLYKETIAAPVVGCGHYEPLRHYAEAHLRLSPAPRGSGITFDSRCHVDDLHISFQSLIRSHVFERTHPGVLTGSPITDIHVELLSGRAHLKHTEGGDFRESTYRAIRQGLMKAKTVLLEPFYRFTLTLPKDNLGRAMTDILARFGSHDAPEMLGEIVRLSGRGPVSAFLDYPTQVRAYSHGKGSILFQPDGYDVCHNPDEVVSQLGYNCGADTENPTGSVFCSHGAGFYVNWDEADRYMHLEVEEP
ncbi:MAG: TetM/TetW/TetO/TetS family tetracycline resistance ribosomal protection protein [Clostridiales bacterium]|nr:TetM/TetW/TetO/TetS family tetracycline resistance ribosomal protection protein [Clostridiales bacterium]